ncbi:MAG TPA: type II toxin-antitoxin system VapC family toxin [Terriglobia bacterium]|nr:type II toxin-antitoxin system VapC family toxin [Terriglobia bacterium]
MTIADTDVLIDFLGGQKPGAGAVAAALSTGQLHTTAVSSFELLSGARLPRERRAVESLLDSVPVLPLDREAAARAAAVRQELDRSGVGIGMADSLIAGIALVQGASLLTRNRRHFERINGLALPNIDAP